MPLIDAQTLRQRDIPSIALPGVFGETVARVGEPWYGMLWGSAGSGKSTFALAFAEAYARLTGRHVLYVSAEERDGLTLQERMERLDVQRVTISTATTADALRDDLAEARPHLIVLDSATTLDPRTQDMGELFDALKASGTSALWIAHATKTGTYRGGSAIAHDPDCVLHIERHAEETGAVTRTATVVKNRLGPETTTALTHDALTAAIAEAEAGAEAFQRENPGAASPEANARAGRAAMRRVIAERTDVMEAMYRDDVGSIAFRYGSPGTAPKFKGASGVAKIIAKRSHEGYDGEAVAMSLPEVIAFGTPRFQGHGATRRVRIAWNGAAAVLSLYYFGGRSTWLLTGWNDAVGAPQKRENPGDTEVVFDTDGSTHATPTGYSSQRGSEASAGSSNGAPGAEVQRQNPQSAQTRAMFAAMDAQAIGRHSYTLDKARMDDPAWLRSLIQHHEKRIEVTRAKLREMTTGGSYVWPNEKRKLTRMLERDRSARRWLLNRLADINKGRATGAPRTNAASTGLELNVQNDPGLPTTRFNGALPEEVHPGTALVHLGRVTQLSTTGFSDIEMAQGGDYLFATPDGTAILVVPPHRVRRRSAGDVRPGDASALYERWHSFPPDAWDYVVTLPDGSERQPLGWAEQIVYRSDKIMQDGDAKGRMNTYVHAFDAEARPAYLYGDDVVGIDRLEITRRGILN